MSMTPCSGALANAKGVDLSVLVNELLKKDIELIKMGGNASRQ